MNSYTRKGLFETGLIPFAFFSLPVLLTCGMPFFWDTIQLGSRHAHYFYENNFSSLLLPNDMDSGHIPVFGLYLAILWKVLGKSLYVSHLAMLPFVLGTLFFTRKLVNALFNYRRNWLITCFLLVDATILTQFTLVSPDVVLLFFFTLAMTASLQKKPALLATAFSGLTLTSMRGMMLAAALFIAGLVVEIISDSENRKARINRLWKYVVHAIPVYLPAALLAGSYFLIHYLKRGWIGYHSDMPWAEHFETVTFTGLLRNVLVLGWRLADHGRLFIWLAGAGLFVHILKKRFPVNKTGMWLIIHTLVILTILGIPALAYKNLAGYRYLIPVFFMVSLTFTFFLVHTLKKTKKIILILIILTAGLLSGNFWVWPDNVAKGWDAMLSYLPYQPLRQEMISYLDENGTDFNSVGTGFPNNIPFKYIDLLDDNRSFGSREEGIANFRYIFWSNVFNDFTDEELLKLRTDWKVAKALKKGQVKIILFENPALSPSD